MILTKYSLYYRRNIYLVFSSFDWPGVPSADQLDNKAPPALDKERSLGLDILRGGAGKKYHYGSIAPAGRLLAHQGPTSKKKSGKIDSDVASLTEGTSFYSCYRRSVVYKDSSQRCWGHAITLNVSSQNKKERR